MRVVYITRTPLGTLGTNASYMYPLVVGAKREHRVLVLSPAVQHRFEPIVFSAAGLQAVSLQEKECARRVAECCGHIDDFRADIVHVFHHEKAALWPFLGKQMVRRARPRWVLDIRSPLLMGGRQRLMVQARGTVLQGYADCVTASSDVAARTVIRWHSRNVSITPFGVDLTAFEGVTSSARSGARRFVFAGSIGRARQIDFLVRAFHALMQRSREHVTLDIYGYGNDYEEIARLIEGLGCGDRVLLKGVVDQGELFAKLPGYDVGISYIPYARYEGAPALKTIEYAAAGLHVLASDTKGNTRMLAEGFTFRYFRNDVEAFCQEALALVGGDMPAAEIVNNLAAVKKYGWEAVVDEHLLPIYKRLLKR